MSDKPRLATSYKDVRKAIDRFHKELKKEFLHPYLERNLAYFRKWYVYRNNGKEWRFGPSKFVGYKGLSLHEYIKYNDRWLLDGRVTEKNFRELESWEYLDPATPLCNKLNRQLNSLVRGKFYTQGKKVTIRIASDDLQEIYRPRQYQNAASSQDVYRMANLITGRVKGSGMKVLEINPSRFAPTFDALKVQLKEKIRDQKNRCALCGGRLFPNRRNSMLQSSPDRIDSNNDSYSDENVQITHLACNLAKNKYSNDDFDEWLKVIRVRP